MSAFKRFQSKVFWNHMATNDLKNDESFYRAGPASSVDFHDDLEDERFEEEMASERTKSSQDLRTCANDNANNHRDLSFSETPYKQDTEDCRNGGGGGGGGEEEEEEVDSSGEKAAGVAAEQRSCTPLSQDLRSQDSGFSDSERSEFSFIYENETPRPRRRRKRREGDRSNNQPAVRYCHLPRGQFPSTPSHTSTPKDCKIPADRRGKCIDEKLRHEEPNSRLKLHDGKHALQSSSTISLEDEECLGDFLYTSEPPEDSSLTRQEKSCLATAETEVERTSGRSMTILPRRIAARTSAARAWLADLTTLTENECSATLQSKSLPRPNVQNVHLQEERKREQNLSTMATAAASKLLVRAEQFDKHYQYVVEGMSMSQEKGDWRLDKGLVRGIEEHAFSILSELGAPPPRRIQQNNPPLAREILPQLRELKSSVDDVLDTRLDLYIERVVRELEEASWEKSSVVRGALAALTALGLAGSRAGSSIARCAGVKVLLTMLVSSVSSSQISDTRAAILRALASVCSSPVAIDQFVKEGGPEILTELLATQLSPEKIRMEAAAVIVQITAPWTNAMGLPYLEPFAKVLIPSLSRLAGYTACGQTLLLAVAALNQLSRSKRCTTVMLEDDTVSKILMSVKKATGGNVWIMEQAASLIGQLARFPEARSYLAEVRASVALVCFLRMRPPGVEDAYQKLEFTAAAALTRLCVDPEIARQVVAVGGADCLPTTHTSQFLHDDEDQMNLGLLKYTKSLRRACKRAAKQIDNARECEF